MALRFDAGKTRYDLIPVSALKEAANVFEFGAQKYGELNWKKGMKWTRLLASLERHLHAIKCGEDNDPESGLKHIGHLLCNAMMFADYYNCNIRNDDRLLNVPLQEIIISKDTQFLHLNPLRHKLITHDQETFLWAQETYPDYDVYLKNK